MGVRTVVREVQESSLVFDQWWLELWDEPSDSTAGIWAEVARVVKAEEPRILLIANPPAHWEQASVTLDGTFRRLAPYVDVWWPFHTHLTAEDGSHLAFMRGTGKPIGYYATPGIFVSKAETAAYGFYRKAAWQAFLHDLQGMGFWAYNSYYGNPWDDMDSGVVDWPDAAVVYPGLWGPIPSRNWEAFRDGLDDYRLLRFLSLEAARAQEASDPYSRERGVELSQALRVLAADMDKAQTVSEVEAVRDRLYDLAADWISRV
ncbi:MAG: DUF4091 domain-containing protein [Limnochordales bacterium]|nr:DUF4091 domain-containing protein [Limnochordales bacterium]